MLCAGTEDAERLGTAMDGERRQRLATLMARMAAGDTDALFRLRGEFGAAIAGFVRRSLRLRRATCAAEEIDGLVVDVCLMLFDVAAGWSPEGGALPWVWAQRRVLNLVDHHLGQFSDRLELGAVATGVDGPTPAGPALGDEPPVLELLDRIGRQDPVVRLLQEALDAVASPRDGELFLELSVQRLMGDRSPAVTVGSLLGLHADSVRQQHHRVRSRLRRLAASDARYAPLAGLALVA